MNRRFIPLIFAAVLSGCASFDQSELAQVRGHGVAPAVVTKLDRGDPVAPADVIELTRRGVRDEWIIRQIEDHGVDSFIARSDVASLRRAGVRPAVIDALLRASDLFSDNYRDRNSAYYGSYYSDPYFGYYDPYPGYWSGGVGASFVVPLGHHHHHHHR
ncbi:MAG: hypothetical protein WCF18_08320 [Chthoniobacteraceae bacterium]